MGQVLSRPDWIDELEEEQEQSSEEINESIDNPDLYIDPDPDLNPNPEAVVRQDYTCQICNITNPHETNSLCESCQLAICKHCESSTSNYIVCDSCNDDLYNQNDTLIECQYCGNMWDGHAQCNCYYEEDTDM